MKNEQQIHSTSKIHVKRCCPVGNKNECTLWRVLDNDGYGLGKFGTHKGAVDFAMGAANRRALQAYHESPESEEIIYDVVIED